MLLLSRKVGEKLVLGENIVLTVVELEGKQVRLAIEAPAAVRILRQELLQRQPRLAEHKPAELTADEPYLVAAHKAEK